MFECGTSLPKIKHDEETISSNEEVPHAAVSATKLLYSSSVVHCQKLNMMKKHYHLMIKLSILIQSASSISRNGENDKPRLSSIPPARVISLAGHTSRRQQTLAELSSKNIPFEWMNAINGKNLTKSELSSNATLLARWFMTPGMIGCFLSHRRLWETCVELGEPMLIFEDDVVLAPNFREVVIAAMTQLRDIKVGINQVNVGEKYKRPDSIVAESEWDILLLGAMGCVHPQKLKFGVNWIPSLVGGKWRRTRRLTDLIPHERKNSGIKYKDDHGKCSPSFLHVPMCPYGLHAYIVSPRGASKLLKHCPRASYHVDVIALGLKDLDILAVHPLVAWQTNYDTTLGGMLSFWKKFRFFPRWTADKYTGFELGWALCAPLFRFGGPLLGGRLLLTNGVALGIMCAGIFSGFRWESPMILGITLFYVLSVTMTVRLLSSKWNV